MLHENEKLRMRKIYQTAEVSIMGWDTWAVG